MPGQRVSHPVHGTGTITKVAGSRVTVRFPGGERDLARAVPAKTALSSLMSDQGRDVTADVAKRVDGTFAGLTVRVDKAGAGPASVGFRGSVTDAAGNKVGFFQEILHKRPDGTLSAEKSRIELDPSVQGQGFASAFEKHMDTVHRDAGADRVELHADIDVGGYAWARKGYDWQAPDDAESVLRKLAIWPRKHEWEDDDGEHPVSPRVRAEISGILARAKSQPFGSPGYPTPYEISQVGYQPGARTWPGRELMLASDWHGVRYL